MAGNQNLNSTKSARKDEFYTPNKAGINVYEDSGIIDGIEYHLRIEIEDFDIITDVKKAYSFVGNKGSLNSSSKIPSISIEKVKK